MARVRARRKRSSNKSSPTLRRLSTAEQKRLGSLMTKNNEGSLNKRERRVLQVLVREVEKMTLENARTLVERR